MRYSFQGPPLSLRWWQKKWTRFWLKFAEPQGLGWAASRLAMIFAPPHKDKVILAQMSPRGFIEPTATVYHSDLEIGQRSYVGERVAIFENREGGPIRFGNMVYIYRDCILETGENGSLDIGSKTSIHPRCQINAYLESIHIGSGVMLGPNCALYSYNHGIEPGECIRNQPLTSKGGIEIGDEAWLGVGVTVLSGVRIGNGAVIGAGSVVMGNIPDNAVAVGNPAKVRKMRCGSEGILELIKKETQIHQVRKNE